MANLLIFDSRLSVSPEGDLLGKKVIPAKPGDVTIDSDASRATDAVVAAAAAAARRLTAPIVLTIMCHGKGQDRTAEDGTVLELVGGAGLDIGTPGLTQANVAMVGQWRGLFTEIILLACAVGYKPGERDQAKPKFDGSVFCSAIATTTGATVIASSHLQQYTAIPADFLSIFTRNTTVVDFGCWEGNVSSYDPTTGKSKLLFNHDTCGRVPQQ